MSQIRLTFACEFDKAYSVVVEDDGRVAYAYLMYYDEIVSDVWLYNRIEPPAEIFLNDWRQQPLNPDEYIRKDIIIVPMTDLSQIHCEWDESEDGVIEVAVVLRRRFTAELKHGAKPGWSVFVAKDGPLALVY
ncbi:hypothetical protein A0256_10820 [Mucilaginibacter sp. PAMC 26640]|nr:hypothetical protein A0256_10820 [Mucilaginibacter sp. PAMC 26640]